MKCLWHIGSKEMILYLHQYNPAIQNIQEKCMPQSGKARPTIGVQKHLRGVAR